MTSLPEHNTIFSVQFENGNTAQAVRVRPEANPETVLELLGFQEKRPVIFISGGAGGMGDEDRQRVQTIINSVVRFAQENGIVIIDGGTESGIMKMIGDSRYDANYTFPLIGVSPLGRVSYPGYTNPDEEAFLEDSHTHFVLVDSPDWGGESMMIIRLTTSICGHLPCVGILINGGNIAMKEVYLATTTTKKVSMIVLEGSGRAADQISTAFRSGKVTQRILKAILAGGDIQLVGTLEGPEKMRRKLEQKFLTHG